MDDDIMAGPADGEEWAQEEPEKFDQWGGQVLPEEEVESAPVEEEDKDSDRVYEGICRWFDENKKFGFVAPHGSDKGSISGDVWVHQSTIEKIDGEVVPLVKNQLCTFQLDLRQKKENNYKALKVTLGDIPEEEEPQPAKRMMGRCLWFNPGYAYGFIAPDAEEDGAQVEDIFVHEDNIKDNQQLKEKQRVEFEIKVDSNGRKRAVNVIPEEMEDPIEKQKPQNGKCVFWLEDRGYGFIEPDEPNESEDPKEKRLLVHFNNIIKPGDDRPSLAKGQLVKFKQQRRTGRQEGFEAIEVIPGEIPEEKTYTGTCKWFDVNKGFGLIITAKDEYLVHQSNIIPPDDAPEGELEEGQQCQFSVETNPRGKLRAVKVVAGKKADAKRGGGGGGVKVRPVVDFEPYLQSHFQSSDSEDTEKATTSRKLTPEERKERERARKNAEKKKRLKANQKKRKQEENSNKNTEKNKGDAPEEDNTPVILEPRIKQRKSKKKQKVKATRRNTQQEIDRAINDHFKAKSKDKKVTSSNSQGGIPILGSIVSFFRRWCSRS